MSGFLSEKEIAELVPSELCPYQTPIPTQIVASDEYYPDPQNEKQREVENRLLAMADDLGGKQGMDRRKFITVRAAGTVVTGGRWPGLTKTRILRLRPEPVRFRVSIETLARLIQLVRTARDSVMVQLTFEPGDPVIAVVVHAKLVDTPYPGRRPTNYNVGFAQESATTFKDVMVNVGGGFLSPSVRPIVAIAATSNACVPTTETM